MVTFDLVVRTRASLHTDGDPDQFVAGYDGVIVCEDEDGTRKSVGRVVARRVHAAVAEANGTPLFDVCDCHSQELHDLYALLYRPDTNLFRSSLVRRFVAMPPDLLVIDHVVVSPKWRGLKVGLLAVRRLVDMVGGGCGLVVSEIAPLRRDAHDMLRVPERWLPSNATDEQAQEAAVKLRRHFRQMGFVRLGRTPYYALPTLVNTPTAEELLRQSRRA